MSKKSTIDPTLQRLTPTDDQLLRELIRAEAVVPIRDRQDLLRRLADDRYMLAASSEDETLCFLHVALMQSFPTSLNQIIRGPITQGVPRFGVFYGVTRTSEKLRGHTGLILKKASAMLLQEWPHLTLVTASPMPTFRKWLEDIMSEGGDAKEASSRAETLARLSVAGMLAPGQKAALKALASVYLQTKDTRDRLLDPVARFHLQNGAIVRQIMVGADGSSRGREQSLGVMVSYQYVPEGRSCLLHQPVDTKAALDALLHKQMSA